MYNSKHKKGVKRIVLKIIRSFMAIAIVGLLISFTFNPALASAFSAYGSGTPSSPYRVATCSQLQEMDTNLAGHYKLVANIDCTGIAFTSVGTMSPSAPFTGSLNGDNHTISNLNISDSGLFGQTSGASISNITIASGTVTGNGSIGSFVGFSVNSTLSNLHSSMTITLTNPAMAAYIGGLVGASTEATTIEGSSYSGTMAGGAYVGGLVGYMGNSSTPTAEVLSNSYFDGTLNLAGVYAGGAVGILYSGTIRNVYSAGTINIVGTSSYVGGLVGISYTGATNNNFAATYINGTATYVGAVFGNFYVTTNSWNSTRSNNYYDRYRSNADDNYSLNCAGLEEGSGNCTAVNSTNTTPQYFKNNTTNAPLNHTSWDFTNTWQVTSDYPTLRSLNNFTDPTVPNNGDANGDATADSFQARVASVQNSSGEWSTVEVPSSGGCTIEDPQAIDAKSIKIDNGFTQQLSTMTSFDIYCPGAGLTVPVTIIYDKQYDTSKSVLRHFNTTTNTYSTVPGATFSTRLVGGEIKTIVTYNIIDGGSLDTDGVSNGIIKDPVGISITPGVPNTGIGKTHQPFLSYTFEILSLTTFIGIFIFRQKLSRS